MKFVTESSNFSREMPVKNQASSEIVENGNGIPHCNGFGIEQNGINHSNGHTTNGHLHQNHTVKTKVNGVNHVKRNDKKYLKMKNELNLVNGHYLNGIKGADVSVNGIYQMKSDEKSAKVDSIQQIPVIEAETSDETIVNKDSSKSDSNDEKNLIVALKTDAIQNSLTDINVKDLAVIKDLQVSSTKITENEKSSNQNCTVNTSETVHNVAKELDKQSYSESPEHIVPACNRETGARSKTKPISHNGTNGTIKPGVSKSYSEVLSMGLNIKTNQQNVSIKNNIIVNNQNDKKTFSSVVICSNASDCNAKDASNQKDIKSSSSKIVSKSCTNVSTEKPNVNQNKKNLENKHLPNASYPKKKHTKAKSHVNSSSCSDNKGPMSKDSSSNLSNVSAQTNTNETSSQKQTSHTLSQVMDKITQSSCIEYSTTVRNENISVDTGETRIYDDFPRSPDSGTSNNASESSNHVEIPSDIQGRRNSEASNDSGTVPSEGEVFCPVDHMTFEFEFPVNHCGLLIGRKGNFVHQIKDCTNAAIIIKNFPYSKTKKLVTIKGQQHEIDGALALIRERFPLESYPEVTLEQSSLSRNRLEVSHSLKLSLPAEGEFQVVVCAVMSATHFFVQLPTHPSYHALFPFLNTMTTFYRTNDPPEVDHISLGNIIAVPVDEFWHRAEVVNVGEVESTVRFLDYGGYSVVPNNQLRQMRFEFMNMPFQAIECYLSNVTFYEDTPLKDAAMCFSNLAVGVLSATVGAIAEDGVPYLHLYHVSGSTHTYINHAVCETGYLNYVAYDDQVAIEE